MSELNGTWTADPVHSSLSFTARHNLISEFAGRVDDFTATLEADGEGLSLAGTAKVESIVTKDENLNGHLLSPDFFDAARFPEMTVRSRSISRQGDGVTIEGEMTIRGVTRPVTFTGSMAGPVEGAFGGTRVGLDVEGTIDRTEFGLDWNAPMPAGGFYLSNDVNVSMHLELIKS